MASTQLVRIPESHQSDITEMMMAKKASRKAAGALQSSTVIYTDASMRNRVPATLTLINSHNYSGKPIGNYPATIDRNRTQGFEHMANVTFDPTGSVGCVVYSGLNHPAGVDCAWLMAWTPWSHPFDSTSTIVKVYVETGLVAKYQPGTLDFDKVKTNLDASTNTSYFKDQGTGAEASAQISFGDYADIAAVFRVAN